MLRPDALKAYVKLVRHTLSPTQDHRDTADELIRYPLETKNVGIQYRPNSLSDITSNSLSNSLSNSPSNGRSDDRSADFIYYSDAAFAGDVDDRKSS